MPGYSNLHRVRADLRPLQGHEKLAGVVVANVRGGELVRDEHVANMFRNSVHGVGNFLMEAVAVLRGKNDVNVGGIGMLDDDCHSGYPLSFLYLYYIPNREKSQVICLLIRRSVPSNLHLLKKN